MAVVSTVHAGTDTRAFRRTAVTLADAGYHVRYLTTDPSSLASRELPARLEVVAIGRPRNRLDRLVRCQILALKRVVADPGVGIVHIHDPELIGMAAILRVLGRRVILDVHEDLPDQVLHKHWLPKWVRPAVSSIARGVVQFMPRVADHIIAADPAVADRFVRNGAGAVSLVQNYPDLSELPDVRPARDPRRVVYLGSVTETRGLLTMVEAARLAHDRGRGFSLVVAGPFHPPGLEEEARRRAGDADVEFLGQVDRRRAWELLLSSSVGMAILDALPNYVDAQPTKVFEYLAAGLRVLGSDFPQWQRLFGQFDEVTYVSPRDPEATANKILCLLDQRPIGPARRHELHELVVERWSWTTERRTLLGVYDTLVPGSG